MWIGVISLFPDMFRAITNYGITGRAVKRGLLSIHYWNPREFTYDRHHTIDGRPYGGGSGMVMMVKPLQDAIQDAKKNAGEGGKVIYLSPQGRKLNQKSVRELSEYQKIILVCGRYKGIDERLITIEIDEEWSIGDYILSGGELAAMTLIDAISRILPGTLNHKTSAMEDSFSKGLLDCPHYTRPKIFSGIEVPTVLSSGNHANIRLWKLKQSLGRTWLKRPELLKNIILTEEEKNLFIEFQREYQFFQKH